MPASSGSIEREIDEYQGRSPGSDGSYESSSESNTSSNVSSSQDKYYSFGVPSWKLENVLKHKSCLEPQIKNYGSIDFTPTYTKCEIE